MAHPTRFLLAGVLAIAALVTALSVGGGKPEGADHRPAGASSPAAVEPLDLKTVQPSIVGHYHFAAEHLGEFEQIPCWCGCEQFLAHRHLADCFVRADGRGWEAHAAGCGVCIGEAVIARRMLDEGRTPAEIKAAVDIQFGPTVITTPPAVL